MTVCASMRTEDWREAAERAMAWYLGIKHKVSRGEQLRAVSWSELVASYEEQLSQGARRNYHVDTIGRHLSPFFGKFRDVSAITPAVILDYLAHRRTKNSPEPLPQTINRENSVLRQCVFRICVFPAAMRCIQNSTCSSRPLSSKLCFNGQGLEFHR
jgi:hypothetical protein